jgi:RimJ/RimL family protein N-acetyltransferase
MSVVFVHGGVAGVAKPHRVSLADGVAHGAARERALDAVEAAVIVLEDDPELNAGFGAVLNLEGAVELDAGMSDGATGRAGGMASFLRAEPAHGCVEIGHIWFGAGLQRTPHATEAIWLLARHAFDALGNRRLEWKCDAANERSRRAALRFGFTFEGVFRQHMIVKGRNRDTAWFALLDREWPAAGRAFEAWLDPSNFDAAGVPRRALAELRG